MQQDLSFQYPADLEKAKKHRLANRIFKGIEQAGVNDEKCQCCGRRIGKQQIQTKCMYSPVHDLTFLGPGVSIYFIFIQNGLLLLTTILSVFSIYALISNILGNSCKDISGCILSVWNKIAISNNIYNEQSLFIQAILILCFVVLYNIVNQYFIYRVRKINFICDELIISPSDYSIILKNLPQSVTDKEIEQMIKGQLEYVMQEDKERSNGLSINKIILSYNLQTYEKELKEQRQLFMESRKREKEQSFVMKSLTIPNQTGFFAIVIFNKQYSKTMFLEEISLIQRIKNIFVYYCEQNIGRFKVGQNSVAVIKAPEPDDIQWSNAKKSKSSVVRNRVLTHLGGILILLIGFGIQYLLQKAQINFKNTRLQDLITILDSILLNVINALIVSFLIFVTRLQGNYTRTQENQSLLIKICLYQFFNAGIFNSIASIIVEQIQNFNIHGAFSQEIIVFMIANAILPNVINLIMIRLQPFDTLKRYLVKKGWLKYNQKQVNQLFQNPKIHFPVKYSYVIKMIWLSCFYAPFSPVIIPVAIIGLIIYYLTESYLFRTSYNVPKMLSFNLAETAIRLMNFTTIIISGGQMLIIFYIKHRLQGYIDVLEVIPIVITLILSIVMIFLPSFSINAFFFKFKSEERNEIPYNNAKEYFEVTYQETFPLNKASKINSNIENNLIRKIFMRSTTTKKMNQGIQLQDIQIQSPSIFKQLMHSSMPNSAL